MYVWDVVIGECLNEQQNHRGFSTLVLFLTDSAV